MRQEKLKRYILQLENLIPVLIKHFQISEPHKVYGIKITLRQYLALDALAKKGRCTITDLSKSLKIALSTATELVNRLTKSHFIERKKDLKDRRIVWLDLADTGLKILKKVNVRKQQQVALLLEKLSEHNRDTLINILEVVSRAGKRIEDQRA